MATPLNLNCWVLGEDSAHIFPVEIDCGKNVGGLKEAIKEKKKLVFDHITADSLDAWNVSIPIDEDALPSNANLEAQVKNLRLHEKKPLWALKGLLKIFSDLDKETLHVVVKAPPIISTQAPSLLLLNCWVLGEDSTCVFPVKIDCDENVGALKKAIKEEKKQVFDHITADSLDVWNVSIPIDEDTNLEAQVKNLRLHEKKSLLPMQLLSGIFRNVVEQHLPVIVHASTGECSPDFCLSPSNIAFLCR
ncbi:hypothetical protein L208DRAFT_1295299 [Tricholoma matsutake]|nr:hypothetical protein L208DRAFT_1295299 [Tricholoma matsutake 945]